MKKANKALALILVLVLGLSILAGCGGAKLSGKYELVSMTSGGETILMSDYIEMMREMLEAFAEEGDEPFNASDYQGYIEFIDGTKCKMVMFGDSQEGTYKLDGKTIEITADGETQKMTLDGKKITFDLDGESMIFEKK